MIESIKKIGEAVKGLPIEKIKPDTNLCRIIFDLDEFIFYIDCDIKLDQSRAEEFLWIGNTGRGQRPVLTLTVSKPEYLLTKKKNKWSINEIINFISEINETDREILDLRDILSQIIKYFFSNNKDLKKNLEEELNSKKINQKSIGLYTVTIKKNGELKDLAKESGYRKLLNYILYGHKLIEGRCHICGKYKKVLTDPAYPEGSILCMYNIDKAGFMSGIGKKPENLIRTHIVCPECKEKLKLGVNYIERNLRETIGDDVKAKLNLFLIPTIHGTEINKEILQDIIPKIKNAFNIVKAYRSIKEIEDNLKDIEGIERGTYYALNLFFGEPKSSHFAFHYLIQDVPITKISELTQKAGELSNEVAGVFNEGVEKWSIGFDKIPNIFPLRVIKGKILDWKLIVELLDALLTGSYYSSDKIIRQAVLFARLQRYGISEGYNINISTKPRVRDAQMCRGILKYNLLLKLLREMSVTDMFEKYENIISDLKLDSEIEKFISIQGYSEAQTALFLLGVLVGKVGSEQYSSKNDEKKAVLNKIHFEGMSSERVKVLANTILEDLRNYKILTYNEKIYSVMKTLLDRNLEKLIDPITNVFYILSGYAYATLQIITKGGSKNE
ncbi:MAG: type I-B CRISPR-associated protein Cas8b/Csh1 [Candidatus Odinarchaeota archaeon]